jgi:hypothetical protein
MEQVEVVRDICGDRHPGQLLFSVISHSRRSSLLRSGPYRLRSRLQSQSNQLSNPSQQLRGSWIHFASPANSRSMGLRRDAISLGLEKTLQYDSDQRSRLASRPGIP